jgi:predicted transcriptional regulator of viral defense system
MKYLKLKELKERIYFTTRDVAELLGIKKESAKVLCYRYTENGLFVRLKKDLYILREKWDILNVEEKFKIANILLVPSYISLMTALSYYQITTQIQREFYESITKKRKKIYSIENSDYHYFKVKSEFYFGFKKIDNIFIAEKEKAFVDCIYLYSIGKYKFDIFSIDFKKLEKRKIEEILKTYPLKTKKIFLKIWKN